MDASEKANYTKDRNLPLTPKSWMLPDPGGQAAGPD